MKSAVVGTGCVGWVSDACLAEVSNDVLCLDSDAEKIGILKDNGIPVHEPDLLEMVNLNVAAGRLRFTTEVEQASHHCPIQFIAVDTQPDENGSADLKYMLGKKVHAHFGEDLIGKRFALWGLAFNSDTDDMRDAPSQTLPEELSATGATITAYDSLVIAESRFTYGDESRLRYPDKAMNPLNDADALESPVVVDKRDLDVSRLVREQGISSLTVGR